MFDIGVNLTSSQLLPDLERVIERAFAAGIRGMAITGTSVEDSRKALEICRRYGGQFDGVLGATAGIHPHHADQWDEGTEAQLRELLEQPETLAVGETGLDFNRNYSSKENQLRAFDIQLNLAVETGLPLFLHERDAFNDQIRLLRKYRGHISQAVVHCFTGDAEQLNQYLQLDFYIGITGWVCDERRGQALAAAVNRIPLDRLLVETDAPWLLPRNMEPRPDSRRNEPAYLPWVIRKLAECYRLPQSLIAQQCWHNALNLFRLRS